MQNLPGRVGIDESRDLRLARGRLASGKVWGIGDAPRGRAIEPQ